MSFHLFTTRLPAVTDVFGSARNVGALRPGRRVGFRSLASGLADDIFWCCIIFVMRAAPLIFNLAPNSKRVKCTLDHSAYPQYINIEFGRTNNFKY